MYFAALAVEVGSLGGELELSLGAVFPFLVLIWYEVCLNRELVFPMTGVVAA